MPSTGFFAGLLGGIGGQLQQYEDRQYLQKKQDRDLRLKMMMEHADAIEKRIDAAIAAGVSQNPNDTSLNPQQKQAALKLQEDIAKEQTIWDDVKNMTGGGSTKQNGSTKQKTLGGMTIDKIGGLLTKIHRAGRMSNNQQNPTPDANGQSSASPQPSGGQGGSPSSGGSPQASGGQGGPAGGLRQAIPPLPGLSSISADSDPLGILQ